MSLVAKLQFYFDDFDRLFLFKRNVYLDKKDKSVLIKELQQYGFVIHKNGFIYYQDELVGEIYDSPRGNLKHDRILVRIYGQ